MPVIKCVTPSFSMSATISVSYTHLDVYKRQRFKSHGSVREIMDWDEMCKVELPVPSIDKQRSIDVYKRQSIPSAAGSTRRDDSIRTILPS